MHPLLMIAGLISAPVPAGTPGPITIRDPAVFLNQLREMGYAPEAFEANDTTLTTIVHMREETLALVLAGCEEGSGCKYLVGVGSFSDVKAPPAEWVAEMNADFDRIKIWINDKKGLSYSDGAVVEGMPREAFRAWIDGILDSSDELAREAISAGYTKN